MSEVYSQFNIYRRLGKWIWFTPLSSLITQVRRDTERSRPVDVGGDDESIRGVINLISE